VLLSIKSRIQTGFHSCAHLKPWSHVILRLRLLGILSKIGRLLLIAHPTLQICKRSIIHRTSTKCVLYFLNSPFLLLGIMAKLYLVSFPPSNALPVTVSDPLFISKDRLEEILPISSVLKFVDVLGFHFNTIPECLQILLSRLTAKVFIIVVGTDYRNLSMHRISSSGFSRWNTYLILKYTYF
jgi:hypothetical protein